MKTFAWITAAALLTAPALFAQEMAKPGPEHEMLKKMEGTWGTTMKAGGKESKGTVTYKMELGGLYLCGMVDGECPDGKGRLSGRSLETFDTKKQKYVEVWADSMSTCPMMMEGTIDKASKTMTMTGNGPGMDGKPTTYRKVCMMPDDNTVQMSMYMGEGKEPAFTVTYMRTK